MLKAYLKMQSNAKNLTSKYFNGAEKLTKNHLDKMRSATVSISAIVHAVFCLFLGPIKTCEGILEVLGGAELEVRSCA